MNKRQTISIITITIFAAILLVGPVTDDANAHNKKHKEEKSKDKDGKENNKENSNYQKEDNKNNRADQGISQTQFSDQFSKCISGVYTTPSCNSADLQVAATAGNNAIGQK